MGYERSSWDNERSSWDNKGSSSGWILNVLLTCFFTSLMCFDEPMKLWFQCTFSEIGVCELNRNNAEEYVYKTLNFAVSVTQEC